MSKPGPSSKSKSALQGLLSDFARIVQAPVCKDLLSYRLALRPVLDKIIGPEQKIISIDVDRERLFETAIGMYKGIDRNKHVRVMISFKSDGCVEPGIDGSGLRREFYSTFFKECMRKQNMFVGRGRRKLPSNDMTIVQSGYFEALGRAIVASILNGDCGFPYLAPAAFYYLVGDDYSTHLTINDVPDPDIKQLAEDLLAAKSDDEILSLMDRPEASLIDHIGWPTGHNITMKTRDALVEQLVRWSIIDKRKISLDKLKDGLNHLGFLEATKKNPQLVPLLVYSSEYSVSAKYISQKMCPLVENLACKTDEERRSRSFMLDFIKELSDEEATWLFQFITGSVDPPVQEEPLCVEFNLMKTQTFPSATTCNSKLLIPIGNKTMKEFRKTFKGALENARHGFGTH